MTNDEALLWGSSDQFSNPILPKYKHMLKSIILSSLSPPSGSWYFQITSHLSHSANSNFIQSLPDKLIIRSLPNLKNFFSKNIYVWLVASVNWAQLQLPSILLADSKKISTRYSNIQIYIYLNHICIFRKRYP